MSQSCIELIQMRKKLMQKLLWVQVFFFKWHCPRIQKSRQSEKFHTSKHNSKNICKNKQTYPEEISSVALQRRIPVERCREIRPTNSAYRRRERGLHRRESASSWFHECTDCGRASRHRRASASCTAKWASAESLGTSWSCSRGCRAGIRSALEACQRMSVSASAANYPVLGQRPREDSCISPALSAIGYWRASPNLIVPEIKETNAKGYLI